jgi:hypothetical protein
MEALFFTLMCVCVATRAFFVVDATSSIFIFFFLIEREKHSCVFV